MGSEAVLAAIIASLVSGLVAIVTGLLGRPKMNAEARAASAGGEVAISADAREWARQFQAEAAAARQEARDANERVERCERLVDALIIYTRTCQDVMRAGGVMVPDPPPELRPPL